MTITIKPFEQVIAEALTGLIVSAGQGGDGKKILPRAETALAVASALDELNQGNAAGGAALLQQALSNGSLDPGVALAVQTTLNIAVQQASLLASVNTAVPLIGVTQQAIASNVIAGIKAAAEAEVAKYGAEQKSA